MGFQEPQHILTILTVTEIINGTRVPGEDFSDSDDEESPLSPPLALHDAEQAKQLELKSLLSEAAEVIACLLRLNRTIRNPAPHDQFMTPDPLKDTSRFEAYDINHVKEKFPNMKEYLVTRLGEANSRRRQYLRYREARHKKLSKERELWAEKAEGVQHEEGAIQSTVASTLPSKFEVLSMQFNLDEDDACSESGESQTTFGTSATEDPEGIERKLRCPPIPEEGEDGRPFKCPLCFMKITVRNKNTWE